MGKEQQGGSRFDLRYHWFRSTGRGLNVSPALSDEWESTRETFEHLPCESFFLPIPRCYRNSPLPTSGGLGTRAVLQVPVM